MIQPKQLIKIPFEGIIVAQHIVLRLALEFIFWYPTLCLKLLWGSPLKMPCSNQNVYQKSLLGDYIANALS